MERGGLLEEFIRNCFEKGYGPTMTTIPTVTGRLLLFLFNILLPLLPLPIILCKWLGIVEEIGHGGDEEVIEALEFVFEGQKVN